MGYGQSKLGYLERDKDCVCGVEFEELASELGFVLGLIPRSEGLLVMGLVYEIMNDD